MATQTQFIDNPPPAIDHAKQTRDATFAAIRGELNDRQSEWFVRIYNAGRYGVTIDELSAITGQPANVFSGRITELKRRDPPAVIATKERRKTRSGNTAAVIVAAVHLDPVLPGF